MTSTAAMEVAVETTAAAAESSSSMTQSDANDNINNNDKACFVPCPDKVKSMIQACEAGHMHVISQLVSSTTGSSSHNDDESSSPLYARQQDEQTGKSPLMAAAAAGNGALVQYLLDLGAPWNAVDRQGLSAGDYATRNQHWGVVQLLVDWGTRSELILGMVQRGQRDDDNNNNNNRQQQPPAATAAAAASANARPVEHEPCTKPDFLRQRLRYTEDGRALMDQDDDGVMMEWERPLMQAHAQMLMQQQQTTQPEQPTAAAGRGKRVLNVGFGMGIIDTALQAHNPALHIIIEAHPDVYEKMLTDGWDRKPAVRICFGKWQDVMPQLIAEGVQVDGIFFDTYGEHFMDLEDFHQVMVQMLAKPGGTYSFFNGLAPDNLFFHGVACNCVKLQLSQLGLDCEFLPCEIQVKDAEWEGIRRKYWHGRDTYYLPHATWNAQYLASGGKVVVPSPLDDDALARKKKVPDGAAAAADDDDCMEVETGDDKRQRRG